MNELPEVIQNKIMYLTLSHPIADMIKHTEWFYILKRRAEQPFYSIQELKDISKDEFGEFFEGECYGCGDELDSEEFNLCWWCVFHKLKL